MDAEDAEDSFSLSFGQFHNLPRQRDENARMREHWLWAEGISERVFRERVDDLLDGGARNIKYITSGAFGDHHEAGFSYESYHPLDTSAIQVLRAESSRLSKSETSTTTQVQPEPENTTGDDGEDTSDIIDVASSSYSVLSAGLAASDTAPTERKPFTDSGYASLQHPVSKPSVQALEPVEEDGADDAATVYSAASSIPENDLDTYKNELSESILKAVLLHVPDAVTEISRSSQLFIPALLGSFALRLGRPGSSSTEKQIMYFIYKYRADIAQRLSRAAGALAEEDHHDGDLGPRKKGECLAIDISEWIEATKSQHELGTGGAHIQPEAWSMEPETLVDRDGNPITFGDDVDDKPFLPDQLGYRDAVFNSVAYSWLIASFVKTFVLAPIATEDTCADIRREIYVLLGQKKHISSKRASETYTVHFHVDWNPSEFLRQQFSGQDDIGSLLSNILTYTGTLTDAQVLPCAEYLRQTWPVTGAHVLKHLTDALSTGEQVSGKLVDECRLKCKFGPTSLDVQVDGTQDSIAEVGEQIGWLGATIRDSEIGSGLAVCQTEFNFEQINESFIGTFRFSISIPTSEEPLYYSSPPADQDLLAVAGFPFPLASGKCWHNMVRNPAVALGYPVRKRTRHGTGLEIPLNVMAGLVGCSRINDFEGNYVIKGFSAALVAVDKCQDGILWHLYFTQDGSRISYPDIESTVRDNTSTSDLANGRHIVGWCSEAEYYAGASEATYDIRPSHLPRPGREFALEKVTFSVGQIVTAGCSFGIGTKDCPVRITRSTYQAKLRWIDQKFVLLWDVDGQRGWLLSGSAVLSHLLQTSLAASKRDKFKSEFRFHESKFQPPSNPLTREASLEMLLNPTNKSLELYAREEQTFTETKCLPNGQLETVTKRVNSYTTIRDRVEELYETLEKLIDHNSRSAADYKGADAKLRVSNQLLGWDFHDIATDRDPFYLRKATLGHRSPGWDKLIREIGAITLFGNGFGELVKASTISPLNMGAQEGNMRRASTSIQCSTWTTVPRGLSLLCVSIADLREIMDRVGDEKSTPITVGPGIFWRNPQPIRDQCPCQTDSGRNIRHHYFQELTTTTTTTIHFSSKSESKLDLDKHRNGAVIFGSTSSTSALSLPERLAPVSKISTTSLTTSPDSNPGPASVLSAVTPGTSLEDACSDRNSVGPGSDLHRWMKTLLRKRTIDER